MAESVMDDMGDCQETARMESVSLLRSLVKTCLKPDGGVGLAGGVFQNRVLTEKCIELLVNNDFEVTLPLMMPVNDAGISFGQIVEFAYKRR